MLSFASFVFGSLLGIFLVLGAEVACLMYFVKRLNRKKDRYGSKMSSDTTNRDLDPRESIDFSLNKQGLIWILELDEGLMNMMNEKLSKESKKKKDLLEVHPIRKFARIKNHKLFLSDDDGTQIAVNMEGCSVEAVSGNALSTRKWAKRFPIQVESKTSVLYKGNRVFYIFLETSWEKESWCKALRLAACKNEEKFNWSTKLKDDFRNYLVSLNVAYPSFLKPSSGFTLEALDKGNKTDSSSAKVRTLWKKFSKRCSTTFNLAPLNREDKKTSAQSSGSSGKSILAKKIQDTIAEETDVPIFSRSWSHGTRASDVDSEEKFFADEGTLAWNLLISRLFFDVKRNTELKKLVHERIQRLVSNMRIPSYIGDIICCDVDIGNLPPYIHGTRILPMEMNGVWAFELDVEYSGSASLEVETRVDAREEDLQKRITDAELRTSSTGDVPPDLLKGLVDFEKQLGVPGATVDAQDLKNEGNVKADESKSSKGTKAAPNNVSKWKSILKNIAEQVSQVPITLSIGVSSIRGTLRIQLKPPPSDQLWVGFTSMPDIEFDLSSSVGEHKITNSHVAMFLINRFKTAIRDVMVLPNCENITIPWMTAEKDDWVQRQVAPFMWLNQDTTSDHDDSQAAEAKSKGEKAPISSSSESEQTQKAATTQTESAPVSKSTALTVQSDRSLEELKIPLLESSEKHETISRGGSSRDTPGSFESPSRSMLSSGESPSRSVLSSEEDESKAKKMGRKAKMFGKKVGEKLEEKSRQIVEKMRKP